MYQRVSAGSVTWIPDAVEIALKRAMATQNTSVFVYVQIRTKRFVQEDKFLLNGSTSPTHFQLVRILAL